jgi:hypothetical protein
MLISHFQVGGFALNPQLSTFGTAGVIVRQAVFSGTSVA